MLQRQGYYFLVVHGLHCPLRAADLYADPDPPAGPPGDGAS
ncbi:MAG: hypothetical protein OER92_00995 [Alphaproteobacteria bacterium]|nr:hypothetical protein [Alphaproteobacteria bacterium]